MSLPSAPPVNRGVPVRCRQQFSILTGEAAVELTEYEKYLVVKSLAREANVDGRLSAQVDAVSICKKIGCVADLQEFAPHWPCWRRQEPS